MNKYIFASLFVIPALFVGCGKSTDSDANSEVRKPRIAVVPKASDVEFWKMVQGGVMKAASEEPDYEIFWQPPAIADDRSEQIKTVQNLQIKKVDAISIAPIDAVDLVKSVNNAKAKGIKTVIFDSGLDDENAYEAFVATDNFQGGVACAKAMAEALGGSGNVAVIRFVEGSLSTELREKGFMEEIAKHEGIKVISDSQRGGDVAKSQEVASRVLQKDGNNLQGIFCSNQTVTEGMLKAMEKSPLKGKIKIIGFDFNSYISESINNGLLHATASQDPFNMGYLAAKTPIALLKGETVDRLVDTGVSIITKANIDDPAMKEILYPDYKKWINE